MTPIEKSKDLVEKFMPTSYVPWMGGKDEATQEESAKEAALICVDEIIYQLKNIPDYDERPSYEVHQEILDHWKQVKEELLKQPT